MRDDGPSRTALGVAAQRLALPRAAAPTGDPGAEERLVRDLLEGAPPLGGGRHLSEWVRHRTRFFDGEVVAAIAAGVPQIVLVAAGYDGRALRFRTPGVRFFELDHPLTQHDKRARLAKVGARVDDVTFVSADFGIDDVGLALAAQGHDANAPTLFTCEGLVRYLTEDVIARLFRGLGERAAPRSVLAVSITTVEPGAETTEVRARREERSARLAELGEAVVTVPPRATALAWFANSGWSVASVEDTGDGSLLVRATR